MIYLTSDLHLGHDKDFLYGPRGFSNITEHDCAIANNWYKQVTDDDDVYILGDVMLGNNKHGIDILKELPGRKFILVGNHDSDLRQQLYVGINWLRPGCYAIPLKYKKYNFYLSHYPTICSNKDVDKPLKHRMINLCGHSHTKDKFADMDKGLIYHVELDAHNNHLVSIDKIIMDIKEYLK